MGGGANAGRRWAHRVLRFLGTPARVTFHASARLWDLLADVGSRCGVGFRAWWRRNAAEDPSGWVLHASRRVVARELAGILRATPGASTPDRQPVAGEDADA
jgi:hypothetical protein